MQGVVPGWFGERRLIDGAPKFVLAILDPVGPGKQHLATPDRTCFVLPIPVDDVAAADRVDTKPRSNFGYHRPLIAGGQNVLLAGGLDGGHLPPDNRVVARLKLGLFGTPRDELANTVDGEVPEWIERLYESYGTTADSAPASASVLALGESLVYRLRKLSVLLKKMEALGWSIKPRRWDLVASTDLDEIEAQAQLEAAGVWVIARQHAPTDTDGNVQWSHGLLP